MAQFLEHIRTHFNIIHQGDYLSLTLINPNISAEIMKDIRDKFKLMSHIRRQQIIILQTVNFDDELLIILAESLPPCLTQLSLDFTGCESLKGSGFLDLFEKISSLDNLTKLHLDFSEVYDINDFVIEGLSMLLETLVGLKDFYLDLYEVDQITQDGYLMLAESLSHLVNLNKFHIDLSANPNLTEDALQLMFSAFPSQLSYLGFRILDIEHIGGGSFFKLAQSIAQMKRLNELNLTISTFSNLNHKGLYSVIKSIGELKALQTLFINFSNVNLPEKMLSYFNFSKQLKNMYLDFSCNQNLSDKDLVCLTAKINVQHKLKYVTLNFDFCKKMTEQAIETLLEKVFQNKSLLKLSLPDRKYSSQFLINCIDTIQKSGCQKSLINFVCGINTDKIKSKQLLVYKQFKDKQKFRRNIILASALIKKNTLLQNYEKDILQLFIP